MRVIGIDPGSKGAIASLSLDGRSVRIWDLPYEQVRRATGRKKSELNYPALALLFDEILTDHDAEQTVCYLEWVHSTPQMGVASAFSFGESFGAIRAVLASHKIRTVLVLPQLWKKACRIMKHDDQKTKARNIAMATWPTKAGLFRLAKDDGRAEASLIAWYGWKAENVPAR